MAVARAGQCRGYLSILNIYLGTTVFGQGSAEFKSIDIGMAVVRPVNAEVTNHYKEQYRNGSGQCGQCRACTVYNIPRIA